jgi:hypothetical protein
MQAWYGIVHWHRRQYFLASPLVAGDEGCRLDPQWIDAEARASSCTRPQCFAVNPPPTQKLPGGERAQDTKRDCAEVGHLPRAGRGTLVAHLRRSSWQGSVSGTRWEDEAPRRGARASAIVIHNGGTTEALECQHERRAHRRGHLTSPLDGSHHALCPQPRPLRRTTAVAMRTRQSWQCQSPHDPCSWHPGDHGLLTPWAATGRRKAVVGPHRRGGGAHDEPTRGNNSWQRLTSRYERRHRRHPTQAPPGEGPKGPGRARSGEAGVRSEPRRPGDDGHH